MSLIAYTVIASCPDQATRERYLAWLTGGHIDDVRRGGAIAATLVRVDAGAAGGPFKAEVRYRFADRVSLDRYVKEVAPGLRAQGLALFPPESGVTFERSVGEIVG